MKTAATKRIEIRVTPKEMRELDAFRRAAGRTRSDVLREYIRSLAHHRPQESTASMTDCRASSAR